jgi:NAD(P)-dependent dehydrogenase (short-subunit alcohol dehydrogenase family)
MRAAIVTGAGSGIGRAAALALAGRGYAVALAGRNVDRLRAAAETIERSHGAGRVLVVGADMTIQRQVEELVDRTVERFGRVDVLVNNAGDAKAVPIRRTSAAAVRDFMEVNAIGPAAAILRAWPIFERQGGGCVVSVSSMATVDPFPGFFAYAASKAPLSVMTKSIAKEGAAIGVTAYCIAPGAVETPLLRRTFDAATVPAEACLSSEEVAGLIIECVEGGRPEANGVTLAIVREGPGVRAWAV